MKKTVTISVDEYQRLKKKAALDDIDLQIELGLEDLKAGRIKRVA